MKKRRRFTAEFKAKVALEAIKGQRPIQELAKDFDVHPNQIAQWKRHVLEGSSELFRQGRKKEEEAQAAELDRAYRQVGRLQIEVDWLKKSRTSGLTVTEKRSMVEEDNVELSIRRQCQLLVLPRSSYYRSPGSESEENLALMRLIDEEYLRHPFFGTRKMRDYLVRLGHEVNRKRVQRLMRLMGLESIAPRRKRTTVPDKVHKVYPYLLRDLLIDRPNQVWCSDITYVPIQGGFVYLTAVMDWYSRYVLSWEVSITMDDSFCVSALDRALRRYQKPEIFNTDQGSQYTGTAFTGVLKSHHVQISMDGKGRVTDNIMIERLWRSLKYEDIYIKDYQTVAELVEGLRNYFDFYNNSRPHHTLNGRTPAEVYHQRPVLRKAA